MPVGQTTPLATLNVTGNTIDINASVTTSGTQIYTDSGTGHETVTANGITLTGSTVTFNGQLSPGGDGSAATLNVVGNLTFGSSATLYATLDGMAAGTSYDQVVVTGGASVVTINDPDLVAGSGTYSYNVGNTVTIINNLAGNAVVGSGLPLTSPVNIDGQNFSVSVATKSLALTRADFTWTWNGSGGANANWSDAANWTADTSHPGSGDSVIFAGTTSLSPNNDLALCRW